MEFPIKPLMDLLGAFAMGTGTAMSGRGGPSKEEKKLLKWKRWMSEKSYYGMMDTEKEMREPIDFSSVAMLPGLFRKAALPQLKQTVTSSAAKYGLRSPRVAGELANITTQSMAGPMSQIYSNLILERFRNLARIYAGKTALARI
jgi:hypothetical protein